MRGMVQKIRLVLVALALVSSAVFCANPAHAYTESGFRNWLAGVRAEAARQGISQQTLDAAFSQVKFLPRVIALDRKQPEKRSFAEYKRNILGQKRIDEGRGHYSSHRATLTRIERQTGVPASVMVALWGIETHYGRITGDFNIFSALATLGYEGRRGAYFRQELMHALHMVDRGYASASRMKGSWAGAMGQCQFMPSSFLEYAADGNADGQRDIWRTKADVFASTANYLARKGWKPGQPVLERIEIPANFPRGMIDSKKHFTLGELQRYGIHSIALKNNQLSSYSQASVWQPDGKGGPAYLLYDNHRVLMRWNKSTYFAASVGMLAGLLAK